MTNIRFNNFPQVNCLCITKHRVITRSHCEQLERAVCRPVFRCVWIGADQHGVSRFGLPPGIEVCVDKGRATRCFTYATRCSDVCGQRYISTGFHVATRYSDECVDRSRSTRCFTLPPGIQVCVDRGISARCFYVSDCHPLFRCV